jgi:hypothetical protein
MSLDGLREAVLKSRLKVQNQHVGDLESPGASDLEEGEIGDFTPQQKLGDVRSHTTYNTCHHLTISFTYANYCS